MRVGYALTIAGAGAVLFGALALGWQHFEIAGLSASAWEVPPAGQLVVSLALVVAALGAAGLWRRRAVWAVAAAIATFFLLTWIVVADATAGSAFEVPPDERVSMGLGHDLALAGALLALFGAIVALSAPRVFRRDVDCLRVAVLWKGGILAEQLLQDTRTWRVGAGPRNDLVVPSDALPERFPLFRSRRPGRYELGISDSLHARLSLRGETQPAWKAGARAAAEGSDPEGRALRWVALEPDDWGVLHLREGDLRVFFQHVAPPRPAEVKLSTGRLVFDEVVMAAVSVSFLLQLGFLFAAVFTWDASPKVPERSASAASVRTLRTEAVIADPLPRPRPATSEAGSAPTPAPSP